MTDVLVWLTRPAIAGGREGTCGSLICTYSKRRSFEGEVVLPESQIVPLDSDGKVTLHQDPTDETCYLTIVEDVPRGRTRFVEIPDSDVPVNYNDLVDVDPATDNPADPVPPVWLTFVQGLIAPITASITALTGVVAGKAAQADLVSEGALRAAGDTAEAAARDVAIEATRVVMRDRTLPRLIGSTGRNDVVFMGDSLSDDGNVPTVASGDRMSGFVQFGNLSWGGMALLQVAGRWVFGGVAATHGFTTAQIRAIHLPTVIAKAPAVCFVLAGTNNTAANDLPATTTDLKAIYNALIDANIMPVLCTIPPQGAAPVPFVTKLNAWIKRYARLHGLEVADHHSVLADNAGGFAAANTRDGGTHPSDVGVALMGAVAAAALNALPVLAPPPMLLGGNDTSAMLTDVTFTAAGVWTLGGTGTLGGGAGAGWKGTKAQLVASGVSHNKNASGAIANQPVAADRISVASLFDVPVLPVGGTWSAGLYSGPVPVAAWTGMSRPIPVGSMMAWYFQVAAEHLAQPLKMFYAVQGADTSRIDFAQTSLLNLSGLGVHALL